MDFNMMENELNKYKVRISKMKFQFLFLIIIMLFLSSGCYGDITGTVVDVETGKPVEGAVVLVEWTMTKGLGLTYTKSYKVVEALSDKEGKFSVEGVSNPLVNPPDLTIYKKGYVVWNNLKIFPDYKKREDFKWQSGYVFKLERFKPEYSYIEHQMFITGAINSTIGWEKKKVFLKAYYEAEEGNVIRERSERDKKRKGGITQ